MTERHPFYSPHATAATEQRRKAERRATPRVRETESGPDAFTTAPAWIDAQGRTRTWAMYNPHGVKMAEITTKAAAVKLAALLTDLTHRQRPPSEKCLFCP